MKLYHFRPEEFRDWFDYMDPRLLVCLDVFRHNWGRRVMLSPHHSAIGRRLGDKLSDHNLDRWGEVRAVDVLPEGMDTRAKAERALETAQAAGFSAIGLYPDWEPSPGLHLGTRHQRTVDEPAVWGAVKGPSGSQIYVSLDEGLGRMP